MRPPFLLNCILILISTLTSIAQPPEQFTYQAVVRDSNNFIIRNTTIGLRLSVLKDSSTSMTPLYSETHTLTTNSNGLITTEIGGGTVESGNFSGIMWGDGMYFIKTEIDVDGGTDYGIIGVTRVLSVPYALYSNRSQYSDTSGVTVYSDSARVANTATYSDSARVARLLPRMTTSQRDSIKNPEQGLQIFNLTTGCLELNMGLPASPVWVQIGCARVNSLLCGRPKLSNQIYEGGSIDSMSIKIPYLGGNSGYFLGDTIESTQVTGMTAIIESGYLLAGNDSIQINLRGVPMGNGFGYFPITIVGQTCSLSIYVGDTSTVNYPDGYVHCDPLNPTEVVEVWNPITNKIWMDRNLGASRVAQSSADALAKGDLFQWGRFADGHQCRDSETTGTNATTAVPNAENVWDGKFILSSDDPKDWLIPQNDNLWQGVDGVNNPCPSGFRLPTTTEWEAELNSWSDQTGYGALLSPLKLPPSGYRSPNNGTINSGSTGFYWSSSVSGLSAIELRFSSPKIGSYVRASGDAVRCIKD